jgi:hypothetical protein
MEFELSEIEAVVPAIEYWAGTHSDPDMPLIAFAESGTLSPREIGEQVNDPGPLVRQFLGIVAFRVRRSSSREVAARFYGDEPGDAVSRQGKSRPRLPV